MSSPRFGIASRSVRSMVLDSLLGEFTTRFRRRPGATSLGLFREKNNGPTGVVDCFSFGINFNSPQRVWHHILRGYFLFSMITSFTLSLYPLWATFSSLGE